MNEKILQDEKNGRVQPWRPKKIRSLKVADSFKRLGCEKKAARICYCGTTLGFRRNLETNERKLDSANFCRERLCPMCQWRKSMKIFYQVSKVMDRVQAEYENLVPLFLTLTFRNCLGDDLRNEIGNIFKGWYRMTNHRKIKRIVQGWFRALEVTYNDEMDSFHPHIHAILMVDKSYFKSKDYMRTVKWVQLWRTAMKLDYDPICDIRRVKNTKGKRKAVAEVAKYTLKDAVFVRDGNVLMDKIVRFLSEALHGRRLFAFGGVLKQIAKQIGIEELAEGDLVHIDEQMVREDIATVLEVYRWNFGAANYVREEVRRISNESAHE